ncbi:PAS domain-containing protein [Kordiimonas aestuarii]|uniref:hypothetical protein n=1 Tax=Kordiimonas aestuarii TaxID=1005925 RepID=UPI0021D05377|nr:hypothetical protein [Kordiimonas aestuarii]
MRHSADAEINDGLWAMNGDHEDKSEDTDHEVPDDFSPAAPGGHAQTDAEERRLHLRAFDYWHALKGDRVFPLFKELSPQGLAPFKTNSLLLEFTPAGATVRFVGDAVVSLMEEPIAAGTKLEEMPGSPFATALLGQFDSDDGRTRAAEFEFVEDFLDCRGIMLPFSRTGDDAHFIMVVVSFRQREEWKPSANAPDGAPSLTPDAAIEHERDASDAEALAAPLEACEDAVSQVAHLDGGGRDSLYNALAAALRLYEEASLNPMAYQALLAENNLRVQARAPYTPVLKLTFGLNYDKTRLTEYAAALAFARREGETSETLASFLKAQPGGIKGCVKAEREARRSKEGTSAHTRQEAALATARKAQAHDLTTLENKGEFCLVLARRKDGGGLEAIGVAESPPGEVDAALRRLHRKSE